jgi:nucleoside-diphosphate-sugar epimerase
MALPRLIITGASGFIGRRLLDGLKDRYEIVGLARRSQSRCGAPVHDHITWYQTDIGDSESLATAFRFIRETGGADFVIHLAAHYDFTGEDHPEYWRTNVEGLRNLLEECRDLDLERFVFASSVAACRFPDPGGVLTEKSPPDGEHIYAATKRRGEEMLAEYDDCIPSCILRFAAVFSDWCEYAPLYVFFGTWLSGAWNARILAGQGRSAIPYLHVREVAPFVRRLIETNDRLEQRQVLMASPNHTISHRELYDLVATYSDAISGSPIFMPPLLARIGVWVRDLGGRLLGKRPFERPWMVAYIDRDLAVDCSVTYDLLGWRPRKRLDMPRRIPFLVEHRKSDPIEWHLRNRAALKKVRVRANLRIHRLLEKHQDLIRERFIDALLTGPEAETRFPSYQRVNRQVLEWRFTVALRHVMNSVRTEERGLFVGYCRDFAAKRFHDGFGVGEVVAALRGIDHHCVEVLRSDPEGFGLENALKKHLSMTIEFGCDQVLEVFEDLSGREIDLDC